jgi:hypothetical protein
MPDAPLVQLAVLASGALLLAAGSLAIRSSGARPAMARRLAGAREMTVSSVLALGGTSPLPNRPVRVSGRVRCADPILEGEERLVALHRDVEVRLPDGWRTIERVRDTRSFELSDRAGSLTIDPASALEPLVTIPTVWRGSASELGEVHAGALARLAGSDAGLLDARATSRSISTVDRLLVLARVLRDEAGMTIAPPDGGYIIAALELDDAMRLLGGSSRRRLLGGFASQALGAVLLAGGLLLVLAGWITSL